MIDFEERRKHWFDFFDRTEKMIEDAGLEKEQLRQMEDVGLKLEMYRKK